MQGRLPRHTVATGYYSEELKSTSAMYFAEKLRINSLFPDVIPGSLMGPSIGKGLDTDTDAGAGPQCRCSEPGGSGKFVEDSIRLASL